MLIQSPPLADQLAQIHTALRAQEKCAWLPDAVQALLIACLARIFGRLEQFLRLWQAGTLPHLPARATPHPESVVALRPATPNKRRNPSCRTAGARLRALAALPQKITVKCVPRHASSGAALSPARPRSFPPKARAPPRRKAGLRSRRAVAI